MKKGILVLILVIIVIAGSVIYSQIFMKSVRSDRALSKGGEYVSKMYQEYKIVGQNCQGEDTDDDGYVSCDFRISRSVNAIESVNEEKVINLKCPTITKGFLGSSCKESRLILNN
jgi:flagellar basal body-associated protein FliL